MKGLSYTHIVVYDDVVEEAENIASQLRSYLAGRGLDATIDSVTTSQEVQAALSQHADMWICDVSLAGNDDDALGFEFISKQKPRYPHVAFGVTTANMDQLEHLVEATYYPDFIFPKPLLVPHVDPQFGEHIVSTVLKHTRQNRTFELVIPQTVEGALKEALRQPKFDRTVAECLIRQVFASSLAEGQHLGIVDLSGQAIEMPPVVFDKVEVQLLAGGGRSGSAVFQAVPSVGGRAHQVSVVLKFGLLEPFSQELHNFSRYVKWTLPFSWRVDLLGTGVVGKLGLIAYSLAFEGASEAVPLSRAIVEGEAGPVERLIETIFDPDRKIWYSTLAPGDGDLRTRLTSRYFGSGRDLITKRSKALRLVGSSTVFRSWRGVRDFGVTTANLKRSIDRLLMVLRDYSVCICHGDLHAGNVMMARNGRGMVFIDFQETGFHHVFTDFVFMENAIRKDGRYSWPAPSDLIDWEVGQAEAALDEKSVPAGSTSGGELVAKVRESAFKNFKGVENRANYFFNSLLFSIRMLNLLDLGEDARERLCAHLVAMIHVLAVRGERPPETPPHNTASTITTHPSQSG